MASRMAGEMAEDLEWLVFADSAVARAIYAGEYATLAEAERRARELFALEERWQSVYVMRETDEGTILFFTVDRAGERYEDSGRAGISANGVQAYTRSRPSALAERLGAPL